MFPVGDHPNPPGFPLVNWLLIGVNVAIYLLVSWPLGSQGADPLDPATREYVLLLARQLGESPSALLQQISAYDVFIYTHGYRPVDPSWQTLLSSMFLHAGFAHLAGNMLFLWIFGNNVEHRLGKLGYLMGYLTTGAIATWGFALFASGSWIPMIGASGAISGVLGFYFVWFPRNVVRVFVVLFPFFMDVVVLPARWVLGFYLLVENLLPFLLQGNSGGVAHGAHIGGFVGGVALAALLRRLAHEPNTSRPAAAAQHRRYIAGNPSGPDLAEAHLKLGLWHLQNAQSTTAYQHLLSALDLDPPPEVERQARAALQTVEDMARRKRQRQK